MLIFYIYIEVCNRISLIIELFGVILSFTIILCIYQSLFLIFIFMLLLFFVKSIYLFIRILFL